MSIAPPFIQSDRTIQTPEDRMIDPVDIRSRFVTTMPQNNRHISIVLDQNRIILG
jgi:hypothetical protein